MSLLWLNERKIQLPEGSLIPRALANVLISSKNGRTLESSDTYARSSLELYTPSACPKLISQLILLRGSLNLQIGTLANLIPTMSRIPLR